jgi:hypothetical protein
MEQTSPTPTPGQEILLRTRTIDQRTMQLLPLLQLLELPTEGPSPLDQLRETLIEILMIQRENGERLKRVERMLTARAAQSNTPAARG